MHRPLNPSDLILDVSPLPPIKLADDLLALAPPLPPEIIHGVLHQGSKMIMGGASKGRKSWMLMDLAVCVSEGLEWWGFTTEKIAWIAEVRQLKALPNLKLWNLRGFAAGLDTLRPKISDQLANHHVGLLILDPLYKLLGTADENANTDMALLMNEIEQLAVQHGCAVIFAHHFRKGGPGDTPSMQRISGASTLSRDCVVVEPTLRNFPPQPPFGLRWECPIFTRDHDLDTSQLKGKGGQPPKVAAKQVAILIPFGDCLTKKELVAKLIEEYDCSQPSAYRYIDKALDSNEIKLSPSGDLLVRP